MTISHSHQDRPTRMQSSHYFDLQHLALACGQSPEWILQLLEYEILAARPEDRIHQFFDELNNRKHSGTARFIIQL